jgi:nitronate monooxygenase
MGAGIPRAIPGVLDRFVAWEPAELAVDVLDAPSKHDQRLRFEPGAFIEPPHPALHRPSFLAIVSSSTLAVSLARKATGYVDGFVVEDATAGGHNAPPRGALRLNDRGEPVYGPRDQVDLAEIRALGRPFWLAGSRTHPAALAEALKQGAAGVQLGTAFAFCEESGIDPGIRRTVLLGGAIGQLEVRTDPRASPTGMPFKVVGVAGSLSDPEVYAARERICDLGYLRQPYQKPDGTIGYRCPGEPEKDFVRKGGTLGDTIGRRCLCNGLMATVGYGQTLADGRTEASLVTAGDTVRDLRALVPAGRDSYTAADVLTFLGV